MIFEGTEKKFELILSPNCTSLRSTRNKDYWEKIVKISQASILSVISNSHCDAYLLSESSLFVFDHKVIMITCGNTLLVEALDCLLKDFSPKNIESLFYERKNENFPHLQQTNFEDDVKTLEKTIAGKTKIFGDPQGYHVSLFYLENNHKQLATDQTLEILMYDIDKKIKPLFHTRYMKNCDDIRSKTSIHQTIEGFLVNDFLFEPSGYSLNAIKDEFYFTYHITPNEIGSYVSFETNYLFKNTQEVQGLTNQIISFFQPKRFDLIYFKNNQTINAEIKNYTHKYNENVYIHCGYEVAFHHFAQEVQTLNCLSHQPIQQEATEPSYSKIR